VLAEVRRLQRHDRCTTVERLVGDAPRHEVAQPVTARVVEARDPAHVPVGLGTDEDRARTRDRTPVDIGQCNGDARVEHHLGIVDGIAGDLLRELEVAERVPGDLGVRVHVVGRFREAHDHAGRRRAILESLLAHDLGRRRVLREATRGQLVVERPIIGSYVDTRRLAPAEQEVTRPIRERGRCERGALRNCDAR